MKNLLTRLLFLGAAAFTLTACATSSVTTESNYSTMSENIVVQSASDFDTSDRRLRDAIAKRDLKIFTVVNHGEGAKSVGKPIGQSKLYLFGSPKSGTPLMQDDVTIGLDLPMKVLIYENSEGDVMLARKDMAIVTSQYNIVDKEELLGKVGDTLDMIIMEAAK